MQGFTVGQGTLSTAAVCASQFYGGLAPDRPITRQEIALILANAAGRGNFAAINDIDVSGQFVDYLSIDGPYRESVGTVVRARAYCAACRILSSA
ncbi:MAG: hypothetical protein LBS62_08095 [Clostridiales bacterium]|nr:hypothetical protein [Clostridiales bacterium]